MLPTIVETIAGTLVVSLIVMVARFILAPVVWLISLPFILLIALFRRGPYSVTVLDMLASENMPWRDAIAIF